MYIKHTGSRRVQYSLCQPVNAKTTLSTDW